METLLTESMISCATLFRTAGNFRQDGTQLELIEYHAGLPRDLIAGRAGFVPGAPARLEKRAFAAQSSEHSRPRRLRLDDQDNPT